MRVVRGHLHVRCDHLTIAVLHIDHPDVSAEGVSHSPLVVAGGVAVPETAAAQRALAVLLHLDIAEAVHVIGAEVDAEDAAGLLAQTVLPSENIEIYIVLSTEGLMCHPVKRSLLVERLVGACVSVGEPHPLVSVAAGLAAEHNLVRTEAAGLDMAYLEIDVADLGHLTGLEVHLAESAQRLGHLDRLVVTRDECLGLHGGDLLRGSLAGHGDESVVILAVDAPSAGTAHLRA